MSSGFEQTKEDLQRTVREVIRVLTYRRWAFLVPFCVGASAVFISSHRLPREYNARTVFERRNPVPISKVLERSGPVSMQDMHDSLMYDLMGKDAMMRVVESMGLAEDLPRKEDGRLTSASRKKVQSLASSMRGMLSYRPLQTGHDLDRIQISARGSDPDRVVKVVNAVRDNYFEFSRKKFLARLAEARDFYRGEVESVLKSIDLHEKELEALQEAFPYVNPELSSNASQRMATVEMNAKALTGRIEDYKRKVARLEARLAEMPETRLFNDGGYAPGRFLDGEADLQRERRRLIDYVTRHEDTLSQNRLDKGMLDAHPVQQNLLRKIQQATHDLAMLEKELGIERPANEQFTDDPAVAAVRQSERHRVLTEHADTTAALDVAEKQYAEAQAELQNHDEMRALSSDKRNQFRTMKLSLNDEKNHLEGLRTDERRLSRVLEIDAKDQGIEFITIEEAGTSRRPVSPKSMSILLLAFGVGLAFGACAVFLREFFDHTFHTTTAVGFSLGVPVLEGIDEILLPVDRRKHLIKRLVMVPVACMFLGVLATSGSLAYLSLEHPQKFNRIVQKAHNAWDEMSFLG